jgi:uroporphyrinogen decarboxylase
MDKHERIRAALHGEAVDRVPLSLWRHYHCADRTAGGLATATLELARAYDLDLVKLTPCGLYAVETWAEGCIDYPGTEHDPPVLKTPAVANPAGWRQLPSLEPASAALGRELESIGLVAAGLNGSTPIMMTVFSPLTLAYKLAGERVVEDLRQSPSDLHMGLETISRTTIDFARAALEAGATGVFFATQLAGSRWLTPAEYDAFGLPYDLAVLEAVTDRSEITVLHLHGQGIFFDLVNRYPIHAVSWHNWETQPTLADARQLTDRAFLTGLDRDLLGQGPAPSIHAQVREVIAQTKGRGLILAPSCVIPTNAPPAHLQAVRAALALHSSISRQNPTP